MKNWFLILSTFISLVSFSQERLNKVSINPIQLLGYNRLNIEYERGFNEGKYGVSIYMGRTGYASRKMHGEYSQLSEQNFAVRFYLRSIDKNSFWYGGILSVTSGNIYSDNGVDKAENIAALGILLSTGYQFILKSFYTTPYISAGYAITNDLFGSAEYTGDIGRPTDFLLTYGLKIGYSF